MKNATLIKILSPVVILLFLASCKKETTTTQPSTQNSTTDFETLLNKAQLESAPMDKIANNPSLIKNAKGNFDLDKTQAFLGTQFASDVKMQKAFIK